MFKITLFLLVVFSPLTGYSQQARPTPEAPSTKLETFQGTTGAVIIKGYSDMPATLRGTGGGSLKISAMELTDAQTGRKTQGVLIEIKEGGRLERESRSYIDGDEIDGLLKGIDYIAKIDRTVTRLANFEAIYKTKGDFSVTVFNESSDKLSVAITSGRIGRASIYVPMSDLAVLRGMIAEAQAKLITVK